MGYSSFDDYYQRQVGNGIPVFIGGRLRGSGIGNVLGGLARMFLPVLKRTGKSVLKQGLRTGVDILGDVVSGENIKSSASRRIRQSGSTLLNKASRAVAPAPAPPGQSFRRRPIKRKRQVKRRHSQHRSSKRKKTSARGDIFT